MGFVRRGSYSLSYDSSAPNAEQLRAEAVAYLADLPASYGILFLVHTPGSPWWRSTEPAVERCLMAGPVSLRQFRAMLRSARARYTACGQSIEFVRLVRPDEGD